ncbi:MAG: peptidylprolyl isomerase, FKBP-type [Bryobacterales bacterium]|nr:peptidylprolyl isomerase, FKBP-type [Bryobacterales bacterium]
MRLRHVFLPALLLSSLSSFVLAQAPKPAATAAPKAAVAAPKPASSAAPKPAAAPIAVGAKPAVRPATPRPAIKAGTPKEMTDEQKTIYALGLSVARSLKPFSRSAPELDIVKQALSDAEANKPAVPLETWGPKIQDLADARGEKVMKHEKEASAAYLAKASAEPGAVKKPSGLVFQELTPGTGASPTAADTVKVHYRGTLVDGTEFDSSYKRGEPAQFPLSNVIPGWTEGVQLMKVGSKARLICPSDIAYGDKGRPGIPGGATLVFEIELLEISGK